jgi:hypothetical protein
MKTNFKYTRIFSPSLGKSTFLLPPFWIVNNLKYWLGRGSVVLHSRWPLNPALLEYIVREHFTLCRCWLRPSRQQNRLWDIWWLAHCWRCCGYQATARLRNWGTNTLIFGRLLVRLPAVLYLLSVTFFLVILVQWVVADFTNCTIPCPKLTQYTSTHKSELDTAVLVLWFVLHTWCTCSLICILVSIQLALLWISLFLKISHFGPPVHCEISSK